MTQEDKELLLKELCTRLPYGVRYKHLAWDDEHGEDCIAVQIYSINLSGYVSNYYDDVSDYIDNVRPYLFPLSSMTKEQKKYITDRWGINDEFDFEINPDWGEYFVELGDIVDFIDWLNKNHFDYRGLIEKGLAIDATGLNIY